MKELFDAIRRGDFFYAVGFLAGCVFVVSCVIILAVVVFQTSDAVAEGEYLLIYKRGIIAICIILTLDGFLKKEGK